MQGEVKGEGRATQRETLIMDGMGMKVKDSRDDLSQCGCDTVIVTKNTKTACRRAQSYMLRMLCLSVYVVSLLSTLVYEGVLVVMYTFA